MKIAELLSLKLFSYTLIFKVPITFAADDSLGKVISSEKSLFSLELISFYCSRYSKPISIISLTKLFGTSGKLMVLGVLILKHKLCLIIGTTKNH